MVEHAISCIDLHSSADIGQVFHYVEWLRPIFEWSTRLASSPSIGQIFCRTFKSQLLYQMLKPSHSAFSIVCFRRIASHSNTTWWNDVWFVCAKVYVYWPWSVWSTNNAYICVTRRVDRYEDKPQWWFSLFSILSLWGSTFKEGYLLQCQVRAYILSPN